MSYLTLGPPQPLPPPLPDRLLDAILSIEPWMTPYGRAERACSVTLKDGTTHPRVSMRAIDEYDESWAAGFQSFGNAVAGLVVEAIEDVRPSPHALPPDLAGQGLEGGEWRPGSYRYAIRLRTGELLQLTEGTSVWLPDGIDPDDVVEVVPGPDVEAPYGGPVPRGEVCFFSTPQTHDADRQLYKEHFTAARRLEPELDPQSAIAKARLYAEQFVPHERPLAFAAMFDRLRTDAPRHERFMGDKIELLRRFAEREGHLFIPKGHIEEGQLLDITGFVAFSEMGYLDPKDRERLESIPGWAAAAAQASEKILTPQKAAKRAKEKKQRRRARIEKARRRARPD